MIRGPDSIGQIQTSDPDIGILADVDAAPALIAVYHGLRDVCAVRGCELQTADSEVSADDLDILKICSGVDEDGILICCRIDRTLDIVVSLRAVQRYMQDGRVYRERYQ